MMRSTFSYLVVMLVFLLTALPVIPQSSPDTAEYDVTIVFIGLMTFDRGDSPQAGDPVTVLIPDIPNEIFIGTEPYQHHVGRHIPYILADIDVMKDTHPINDDYHFEDTLHPSDTFHYLPCRGFHLSIDEENDVSVLNSALKYDNAGCGVCPVDDPNNDGNFDDSTNGKLCWMASMSNLTGSTPVRDTVRFARRAPKLSPKEISGRMVLRYGELKSYVITYKGEAPLWEFRRDNASIAWTQALSQETHWTFRARGVPFVLNMNGIKGESQRVAFQPQFPIADQPGKLVIVIGHTMHQDAGPMIDETPTPAYDDHYAEYYRFIESNVGDGPIPWPQDEAYNCKKFVRKPILTELREKAEAAGRTHENFGTRPPGDPSPGGLNCSSNNWP